MRESTKAQRDKQLVVATASGKEIPSCPARLHLTDEKWVNGTPGPRQRVVFILIVPGSGSDAMNQLAPITGEVAIGSGGSHPRSSGETEIFRPNR